VPRFESWDPFFESLHLYLHTLAITNQNPLLLHSFIFIPFSSRLPLRPLLLQPIHSILTTTPNKLIQILLKLAQILLCPSHPMIPTSSWASLWAWHQGYAFSSWLIFLFPIGPSHKFWSIIQFHWSKRFWHSILFSSIPINLTVGPQRVQTQV